MNRLLLILTSFLCTGAVAQQTSDHQFQKAYRSSNAEEDGAILNPEGKKTAYFFDAVQNIKNYKDSVRRCHVSADVVMNGSDVYLPSICGATIDEGTVYYLKGKISADKKTITMKPGGVATTRAYAGQFFRTYIENAETGAAETSKDILLNYDSESGAISLAEGTTLGVYQNGKEQEKPVYHYTNAAFTQADSYPDEQEWSYSCTDMLYDEKINGKLKVIDLNGKYYIKGILAEFPNAWQYAETKKDADGERLVVYEAAIEDGQASGFRNISSDTESEPVEYASFTFDGTKTFTIESGMQAVDWFYYSLKDAMASQCAYADFVITKPELSSIRSSAAEDKQRASCIEYYSISGQRIDSRYKGIAIKVTKYADGKTKTEKMMM